ncbi:MAG: TetR/AcrR family transcriptional regulator, partial [Rhodoferax sp.]
AYQFMLGALLHHIGDERVQRLSNGSNMPNDPAAAPLLAAFITGGLRQAMATPFTAPATPA